MRRDIVDAIAYSLHFSTRKGKQVNREVINKNKEAFDTWLKTGKVWLKTLVSQGWIKTSQPCWSKDSLCIADDEYAELKMAYADGKIIQLKHYRMGWTDLEVPAFKMKVCEYRIKPEDKIIKTTSYFSEKSGRTYVTEKCEVEEKELSDKLLKTKNTCCETLIGFIK